MALGGVNCLYGRSLYECLRTSYGQLYDYTRLHCDDGSIRQVAVATLRKTKRSASVHFHFAFGFFTLGLLGTESLTLSAPGLWSGGNFISSMNSA